MFFKKKRLEEPELAFTSIIEKTIKPKNINKQVYQDLIAKRVSNESEEALEVTEILLKSVEDINMEMENTTNIF